MNGIILQQASFSGFVRTFFIILLVWYIFRLLLRIFAPYLMKKLIQKTTDSFHKNYEQQFQRAQNKNKKSNNNHSYTKEHSSNKKIGEYIDYEEID